ncbi:MAG: hypothetical protein V4530_01960 [Pseudomonadota bacterium]
MTKKSSLPGFGQSRDRVVILQRALDQARTLGMPFPKIVVYIDDRASAATHPLLHQRDRMRRMARLGLKNMGARKIEAVDHVDD